MTTIYHTRDLDKLPQDFYLFGYGANNIENLAKRLFGDIQEPGTDLQIKMIGDYSSPGLVNGWKRIFFSHSKNWGGSVASIKESEGNKVRGVLTRIRRVGKKFYIGSREINLKGLFGVEAVDQGMYWFQPIAKVGDIYVYAFIGNTKDYLPRNPPSERYQNAIRKTISYATGRPKDDIIISIEYGYD